MPRYRLYIDESGDHTYNKLDTVGHRYLALLGVWFRQSDDYLAFARDSTHSETLSLENVLIIR